MRYSENEICYKCGYIIPRITLCPHCRFYNKISEEGRENRMLLDWPIKPKEIKPKKPILKGLWGERKCLTCGTKYIGNAKHSYCSWHCSNYTSGFAKNGRKKWLEEFLGI